MTSVFLLFSLLIPDGIEVEANGLFVHESTEPKCDTIERMLAKYDAEYEVELVLETVSTVFE